MNKQTKRNTICFRRWSRKNFAAFASMGKVVKIGFLAASFSMISSPIAKGENQLVKDSLSSERELKLNEVTVVGSKIESVQGLTTTLPIISKREVERQPISSIEAALKQSASIDIRERGTKGVQADMSIRGGTFDQNLIFLNGVNFSDSRTGHQSLSLPIDIEIVDQINLLHGLTTPGALTGAINLITASSPKNFLNLEINGGQYGYQLYRANGNYNFKNTTLFGAISHKRSDGYTTNTDFETSNAFVHIKHDAKQLGKFDLQGGYQVKAFGANAFYALAYPNQYERTRTGLASLGWRKEISNLAISSNINYKRTYDQFELFRNNVGAPAWYKSHNYHQSDDAGASLIINYKSVIGNTFFGADYRYEHVYSNVLGEKMNDTIRGGNGSFYLYEKGRNISNFYLKHRYTSERFKAEAIANAVYTPFGNDILWGINTEYTIVKGLKILANANRTLRVPTFTDIYYKSSTQESNPNLKLEKATTFDLGIDLKSGNLTANATVYVRNTNNAIDWIKHQSVDSVKWHAVNYNEQKYGLEASVGYRFSKVLKDVRIGYSHIESDKNLGVYMSKYVLDYAKNKCTISAQIDIISKLSLGIIGTYWDRNGLYVDVTKHTQEYKPYTTLDAQLTWIDKRYTIKLAGTNLTNTEFFDIGGLRQAGTWINGGVIIKL